MTKIMLIVTLVLMGQEKPLQQAGEQKDLKTCESEAHKFLTHKFADEVQSRVVFRSAACAIGMPGHDT